MLRVALASLCFTLGIETAGREAHRRLLAAAEDPRGSQRAALAKILRALAPTELGQEFGYTGIRDPDEFRRQVPVHDYEALRPYVARQIATGARILTPTRPEIGRASCRERV